MSTSDQEHTSISTNDMPYIAYLETEIRAESWCLVYDEMCLAFRDLLLSPPKDTAATTALRIDASYTDILLREDPFQKFVADKGMGGFLHLLWELVFEISKYIKYDDPKQDVLLDFILELHKLPPKCVKIWDSPCEVYSREHIFWSVLTDCWNGNYVIEELLEPPLKEQCEQWINFCAFVARCDNAHLDSQYPDNDTFACRDIQRGIEQKNKPGLVRDCDFMVAAQYILISHPVVFEKSIEKAPEGSKRKEIALKRWPLWISRLQELAIEYDELGNTELATIAREAREKLELYPI